MGSDYLVFGYKIKKDSTLKKIAEIQEMAEELERKCRLLLDEVEEATSSN